MAIKEAGRARRPSITDVARRAGVSVGTVSNVLNRPDHVAPTTRDRVQSAIDDLGFVRNAYARQLRVGSVPTLGAIVIDIANPFFTDIARGIEDRISPDDVTLLLSSSDEDEAREAKYLRLHEEQGVQGLIVSPAPGPLDRFTAAKDRGMRIVLLDVPAEPVPISSVGVDDVRGACLAVEHLLALGHRRIALINGPHAIRLCRTRLEGSVQAITDAGLDPDEVLVEVTVSAPTMAEGSAGMSRILAMAAGHRPTATFAANDLLAVGALRALTRAGLKVPDDMALVGYDDIPIVSMLAVPLTSVSQPAHTIGWTAADLLLRTDAASDEHQRIMFQPELIVRESTFGR